MTKSVTEQAREIIDLAEQTGGRHIIGKYRIGAKDGQVTVYNQMGTEALMRLDSEYAVSGVATLIAGLDDES